MKNAEAPSSAFLIVVAFLAVSWIACAATGAFASAKAAASRLRSNPERLPLYFVENAGQVDAQVRYYVQGFDKAFYFTAHGVTLALQERRGPHQEQQFASVAEKSRHLENGARQVAVKLDFVGANVDARPIGEEQAPALMSYFRGPKEEWKTGVRTYKRLVYRDLWPGIDLVYSGTVKRLKYMFVVKPGADPALIKLAYRGAGAVNINSDGRLEVRTALGGFHDDKPTAYQLVEDEDSRVDVAYQHDPAAQLDCFAYGFRLGAYDPSLPLIIDPAILVYAGFIGGAAADRGNAIAVDAAGSAYVTGETSSVATFPVRSGPDRTQNGNIDAFVAKLAADGETLLYAGFLGGAGSDRGKGIAVDGAGNAYVVGETDSGANFPIVGGLGPTHNGGFDAFVAKVNPSGTALLYAGFIGGFSDDHGNAVALEQGCASSCAAYITGETSSPDGSFPDTAGPDITHNFGVDAFAAKINATGSALIYAGYIGGFGTDRGKGIAVDSAGSAYVTGETDSPGTSFPDGNGFGTIPGFDRIENGSLDAFIVKVNPAGTALVYATYVGGASDDRGNAIAIEPGCAANCAAYITGEASSNESSFPVAGGPDLFHSGGVDAFVAKLAADGLSLVYAGYIGGAGDDRGHGIAVDPSDSAHVTGETDSDQSTFPDIAGPDLTHNGGLDAFVTQVNAAGTALVYAGYIGGLGTDRGKGIALDSNGDVYVVGETNSDHVSFPEKIGPDTTQNGDFDAFVAKICVTECADLRVAVLDAPDPVRVGENVTYTITVSNHGPDTATDVLLSITVPSTVTFVSSVPAAPACIFTVTLECNLGDLNNGANSVVTLVLTADARATLRVISSVSSEQTDTDPSSDQETTATLATFSNLVLARLETVKAALPGATITIDDTTINRSGVAAPQSVTRVYLSSDRRVDDPGDTVLYSRSIPVLASKESNFAPNVVALPAVALGRYYIIGVADAAAGVMETRENNKRIRILTITRPNLKVSALRAPGKVAAGADITITEKTINKSPLAAGASTTLFFLSTDAVFDPGDTPLVNNSRAVLALPPNGKDSGSITATIPGATVPGQYFLIAVADAGAAVTEADETDNTRARRITVSP